MPTPTPIEIGYLRDYYLILYSENEAFCRAFGELLQSAAVARVSHRLIQVSDTDAKLGTWDSLLAVDEHVGLRRGYAIISHDWKVLRGHACKLGKLNDPFFRLRLLDDYSVRLKKQVVAYVDTVSAFADFWGLRSPWAYARLHAQISFYCQTDGIDPIPFGFSMHSWSPPRTVTVEPTKQMWQYKSKDEYMGDVARVAAQHWRDYQASLATVSVGPNWDRDICLLAERCLQNASGLGLSWDRLASDPRWMMTSDAVRKAVTSMGGLIGIAVPESMTKAEADTRFGRAEK